MDTRPIKVDLVQEFQGMPDSSAAGSATTVLSKHTDIWSDHLLIFVALINHWQDAVEDSKKLSRMDTLMLQEYLS